MPAHRPTKLKAKPGAHVVFHRQLKSAAGPVQAVLLCKRTLDAPTDAGFWALFGGCLESGETFPAAAIREVNEELGINLTARKLKPVCRLIVRTVGVEYFAC